MIVLYRHIVYEHCPETREFITPTV